MLIGHVGRQGGEGLLLLHPFAPCSLPARVLRRRSHRQHHLATLQGTMKAVLDKQVSGYKNWKATVTEQVGLRWTTNVCLSQLE